MKQVAFETKSLGNIGPNISEAVAWRCSVKKVSWHATLAQVFPCEFSKIFQNIYFSSLPAAATEIRDKMPYHIKSVENLIYFKNGMVPSLVVQSVPFRSDEYNIIL